MVEVMATPTGKSWADYLAAELEYNLVAETAEKSVDL